MTRATANLIPPSIADERSRAFGTMMERAIADPQFNALLFERIDSVDAAVLPFLVREFSIEEFVEPDMSDAVIRALLKGSYELHATKGYISGVRRGLLMLGMRVVWKQWFQNNPKTQVGTHVATVFINQTIFNEQSALLDERVQRAAQNMINGMKRWSQDITFQLAVAIHSTAGVATAASAASVGTFGATAHPVIAPHTDFGAAATGAASQLAGISGRAAPSLDPLVSLASVMIFSPLQAAQFRMEAVGS